MAMKNEQKSNWVNRDETIGELIQELLSFEDQDLVVEISFDGGDASKPISLVGRIEGKCVLINYDHFIEHE